MLPARAIGVAKSCLRRTKEKLFKTFKFSKRTGTQKHRQAEVASAEDTQPGLPVLDVGNASQSPAILPTSRESPRRPSRYTYVIGNTNTSPSPTLQSIDTEQGAVLSHWPRPAYSSLCSHPPDRMAPEILEAQPATLDTANLSTPLRTTEHTTHEQGSGAPGSVRSTILSPPRHAIFESISLDSFAARAIRRHDVLSQPDIVLGDITTLDDDPFTEHGPMNANAQTPPTAVTGQDQSVVDGWSEDEDNAIPVPQPTPIRRLGAPQCTIYPVIAPFYLSEDVVRDVQVAMEHVTSALNNLVQDSRIHRYNATVLAGSLAIREGQVQQLRRRLAMAEHEAETLRHLRRRTTTAGEG